MNQEQSRENAKSMYGFHVQAHYLYRRIVMYLMPIIAGLVIGIVLLAQRDMAQTVVIAASPDGKIIKATVLSEPIMTDTALMAWVALALSESFTFGHHDYLMRQNNIREHFLDDGYEQFREELVRSKLLPGVKSNLQVLQAIPAGVPIILSESDFQGQLLIALEVPLRLTTFTGNNKRNTNLLVKVLVLRVPYHVRPRGMGIQQIIAEERTNI